MKVKKGDSVLIISGKDKGRVAKILRSLPQDRLILVEGMNVKSKHVKPKKQGQQGQVVKVSLPISVSNAKFICPKCGKAARLGYKMEGDPSAGSGQVRKFRICKKCKSEV